MAPIVQHYLDMGIPPERLTLVETQRHEEGVIRTSWVVQVVDLRGLNVDAKLTTDDYEDETDRDQTMEPSFAEELGQR